MMDTISYLKSVPINSHNSLVEICFWAAGEHDETSMETSIRETCEELLISESNIKLYGPLDYFLSPAGLHGLILILGN